MSDAKRSERCPHCGHVHPRTLLIRTHCQKCGRALKPGGRGWPAPEFRRGPQPSA